MKKSLFQKIKPCINSKTKQFTFSIKKKQLPEEVIKTINEKKPVKIKFLDFPDLDE